MDGVAAQAVQKQPGQGQQQEHNQGSNQGGDPFSTRILPPRRHFA
jgi:hypothetical protein